MVMREKRQVGQAPDREYQKDSVRRDIDEDMANPADRRAYGKKLAGRGTSQRTFRGFSGRGGR